MSRENVRTGESTNAPDLFHSDDGELDIDVAGNGARVRAHLVRLVDELLDLLVVQADLLERGSVDLELDGEEEALEKVSAIRVSVILRDRQVKCKKRTGSFSSASLPMVTTASTLVDLGRGFEPLLRLPWVAPRAERKHVPYAAPKSSSGLCFLPAPPRALGRSIGSSRPDSVVALPSAREPDEVAVVV